MKKYSIVKKTLLVIPVAILLVAAGMVLQNFIQSRKQTDVSPHFARVEKDYRSTLNTNVLGETTTMTISGKNTKKWGIIDGWQISNITNFISVTGAKPNYIVSFIHWGNENEFPKELATYANDNDMTMIIFWEAMNYNNSVNQNKSEFSYDKILAGDFDDYIMKFSIAARRNKKKIILIPFEEANGNWYSWSGTLSGNSPAKHNEAYRYLRIKLSRLAPNVKFGWAMNSNSVPDTSANSIDKYYPGDEYVDYVGVDGFNFGDPWMSYDQIFSNSLTTLEQYHKPVMIFSMSSMEGSGKAAWLQDAIVKISARSSIEGWIWFNETKEHDWSIWSDAATLQTFKQMVAQ